MSHATADTSSPPGTPSIPPPPFPSPKARQASLGPSTPSTRTESSRSAHGTTSHSSVDLPEKRTIGRGGCWTCRLRRKKCDEQREGDTCQTCKRLRIKCLGWGARRPEWMRDKRAVDEYKAGIKEQLNRAGRIRGQPRLSLLNRNAPSRDSAALAEGATRHQVASAPQAALFTTPSQGLPPNHSHGIPNPSDSIYSDYDLHLLEPQLLSLPSFNFDFLPDLSGEELDEQQYPTQLYPQNADDDETELTQSYPGKKGNSAPLHPTAHDLSRRKDAFTLGGRDREQEDLSTTPKSSHHSLQPIHKGVSHYSKSEILALYEKHVFPQQYLLATPLTRWIITSVVDNGSTFEQAITLLVSIYLSRLMNPTTESVLGAPETRRMTSELELTLRSRRKNLQANDAMAALSLISAVLFDGGHTNWLEYLDTASHYVKARMSDSEGVGNGIEGLRRLSIKDAFIVKTTIWFDVLASVTTGEKPLLLDNIKVLFEPAGASLGPKGDGSCLGSSKEFRVPEEEKTSMLSPMGCENNVVWALAEISALSAWKREKGSDAKSSLADPVQETIEKELGGYYPIKILSDFNDDPVVYSRYLTAQIFRTSALLYLQTIVLGERGIPTPLKIKRSVDNVLRWIHRIPKKPQTARDKMIRKSVTQSTLFSFYITGALAEDNVTRRIVEEYLSNEAEEETIGKCRITLEILKSIWDETNNPTGSRKEVPWREKLQSRGGSPLLLI